MRRPWLRAVLGMVLAALSIGLLGGCGSGPPNRSQEAVAHQKAQDTMIRQLKALPGATITADIESSLDSGQNNVSVDAQLPPAATAAQITTLGDSIERTIWLSHLDPLGRIGINFTLAGSSEPDQRRLYIGTDKDALGIKYGPRPDGLTGY